MPDMTLERLVRVETRVEALNEKVDKIDVRFECLDRKVSEIHTTVVANRVNSGWSKKLLITILSVLLGGGTIIGWKSFSNGAAFAKLPQQEQPK